MSRTINKHDFEEWIQPIAAFSGIINEMGELTVCGPSGISGLSCSIAEVLTACIDAARQRFLATLKETEDKAALDQPPTE